MWTRDVFRWTRRLDQGRIQVDAPTGPGTYLGEHDDWTSDVFRWTRRLDQGHIQVNATTKPGSFSGGRDDWTRGTYSGGHHD